MPDFLGHTDRGLGLSFLKHVERTSTLIYIIDSSGEEGRDPYQDFVTLRAEVEVYSPEILKKPFLVVLNKIDKGDQHLAEFKKHYPFPAETLFEISALQEKGLPAFIEKMRTLAQKDGKNTANS